MSKWRDEARLAITKACASLPAEASLSDRIKAVDAAYPFGERQYHPYKMWLSERAKYLAPFGYKKPTAKQLSPLERMMAKAKQ